MTAQKNHACPNCEYERGNPGKPVSVGDQVACQVCGTSWKEFSGSGTIREAPARKPDTIAMLRDIARRGDSDHFEEPALRRSKSALPENQRPRPFMTQVFLVALLLAGGTGLTGWYINTLTTVPDVTANTVSISDVRVDEQISRNGRKVITVKGSINNMTSTPRKIPRVAIILKRKDGGEIVRWRYNPPASSISPGGKTRFASSIQYDTPVIAYAEAIIE